MLRFSTGLRKAMMTHYGLGIMMNGGVIHVYGNPKAASSDDAPGSLPLGSITTEGRTFVAPEDPQAAGLLLQVVNGEILTNLGNWRLRGRAGTQPGVMTWWRWCWADPDDQAYSLYLPRVDGDVGDGFLLPGYAISSGTDLPMESFMVGMFSQTRAIG